MVNKIYTNLSKNQREFLDEFSKALIESLSYNSTTYILERQFYVEGVTMKQFFVISDLFKEKIEHIRVPDLLDKGFFVAKMINQGKHFREIKHKLSDYNLNRFSK